MPITTQTQEDKDKKEGSAPADSAPAATTESGSHPKTPTATHQTVDLETLRDTDLSNRESVMEAVMEKTPAMPQIGDIVEGTVIGHEKNALYINLPPFGTGIIFGKEYINTRDLIKRVNIGDTVAGKVIELEGYNGYIEISLQEARQALIWSEAEELMNNKTVLELPVAEANKGGLIINWQGIPGFLPASQLRTENYPRVKDGDKDKVLEELRKLVGERLSVSIISAIPSEGKLIFSEKTPEADQKEEIIDRYNLGDEVAGEITGIVDFGIFVKLEEGLEGLVHISEIDWSLVEDPRQLYSVGDQVPVKIVDIRDGKISLSIKALKENPWKEAEKSYQSGEVVRGVIIKYNKHGALASIEEGIAGLVHVSDFGNMEKLREKLELGKTYPFTITLFDPDNQRMALSLAENGSNQKTNPAPETSPAGGVKEAKESGAPDSAAETDEAEAVKTTESETDQ